MDAAIKWMLGQRRPDTIVAATDARSSKINCKFSTHLFDAQKDEARHLRLGITFQGNPARMDMRYPQRAIFAGLNNQLSVLGLLPVSKVRMQTRPRSQFSNCGEKNSNTQTYSGVPWRGLPSLPRMSLEVKDEVTGITSPAFPQALMEETRKKGHPLFWSEVLDVEWFINFFKDMNATRVFDLAVGSTAAACAAAYLGVPYEGIAMSKKHAQWCNNIMDKAIFAILHMKDVPKDSKGKKDSEAVRLHADIAMYFKDLVEEGRKYVEREVVEDDDDGIEPPAEEAAAADGAEA